LAGAESARATLRRLPRRRTCPQAINDIITAGPDGAAAAGAAAGDADIAAVVAGFRRWYAGCGIRLFPAGDTVVFSRRYAYAGACDAIGRRARDGALVVVDFKTSNSVHATYALQLAAYAQAVREMVADGELRLDGAAWRAPAAASAGDGDGDGDGAAAGAPPPPLPRAHGGATAMYAGDADITASNINNNEFALDIGGGSFDVFAQPLGGAQAAGSGAAAAEAAPLPPPPLPAPPAPAPAPARRARSPPARRARGAADAVVSEALIAGTNSSMSGGSAPAPAPPQQPPARGVHTLAASWMGGGASRSLATLARAAAAAAAAAAASAWPRAALAAPAAATPAAGVASGAPAAAAKLPVESLVVRIDKATGDVFVSRVADPGAAFAAFKACLLIWHTMSDGGRGHATGLLVKETRES
jgi:hypothetical protein